MLSSLLVLVSRLFINRDVASDSKITVRYSLLSVRHPLLRKVSKQQEAGCHTASCFLLFANRFYLERRRPLFFIAREIFAGIVDCQHRTAIEGQEAGDVANSIAGAEQTDK